MGYDEIWSGDESELYRTPVPEYLVRHFEHRRVRRVLDLGSGDGTNLLFLKGKGYEPHGLDCSSAGIQQALMKDPGLPIHAGDMFEPLPYPDGYFCAIIAFQSLNHNIKPSIIKLFDELRRVVRHGGVLAIRTADRRGYNLKHVRGSVYHHVDLGFDYEFLDEQTYVPLEGPEEGITHYTFYPEELARDLEALGFALTEHRPAPPLWFESTFERI